MFFFLSKALDFALSPVLWLGVLLLAALLARPAGRWRGRWLGLLALLLALGTNQALVNQALLAWEVPPVPLAAVAPADAVVLLTGITAGGKSPHDRVYLGRGADRLTSALWLYRAGKARRIIIVGGPAPAGHPAGSEAAALRTLLRLAAVPAAAILLEERSRNTRENALYTKALLARHPAIRSLILVTSAFHERRALGCFARVGLHPVAFAADFRSTDPSPALRAWLVFDAAALARWSVLVHEIAGYWVYKAVGYIGA